jgi:hypothetical protein
MKGTERQATSLSSGPLKPLADGEPLKVFHPVCEHPAIDLFHKLESLLRRKECRRYLEHTVTMTSHFKESAVRSIQMGRIEMFIKAGRKRTTVFDTIARKLMELYEVPYDDIEDIRKVILDYCTEQAKRDPRVTYHQATDFDNFSLLINYDPVDAQFPHIDLLFPNFQFAVFVSNNALPTSVFTPSFDIETVDDLKRAWPDMPEGVIAAFNNDPRSINLLRDFGKVLSDDVNEISVEESKYMPFLPTGTLLSLPGSVIHAGPASETFRAVLFFSGSSNKIDAYDPDTQYFSGLLLCDFVSMLWERLNVPNRVYLLKKLADNIQQTGYKHLHRHLSENSMVEFTERVSNGQFENDTKDEFIRRFAERQIKFDSLLGLEEIGANDLFTIWEGKVFDVRVFQSVDDGGVRLFYPTDWSWEGRDGNYTIEFHGKKRKQQQQIFDGDNATIRDDEGNAIEIFRKS